MTPRIVDKDQKKKDLMMVAIELFSTKGFDATSINEIAKAAGVGKGTIYEYFESKEELIYESLFVLFEMMSEQIEGLLGGIEDPVERLHQYIHVMIKSTLEDEKAMQMLLNSMFLIMDDKFMKSHNMIRDLFSGMRRYIVDLLLDGVSQGVFNPKIARDAEKMAINLLAYLDGIAMHHFMSHGYFDLHEQVDFFLEGWLKGVVL